MLISVLTRAAAILTLSLAGTTVAVAQTPAPPPASPANPQSPPAATTPTPPSWAPRGSAQLLILDKVSAVTTPVTVAVDAQTTFGPLTISLRACVVRPPDQAPDAAAFLDVADSTPGSLPFHGWMIRSAPAASVFQNPGYDIQLEGCQ